MNIPLRHDRIFPLGDLSAYPGSDHLDLMIFLPWDRDTRRRVWLMAPRSSPTIGIDNTTIEPQEVASEEPRWIDYGVAKLPIITASKGWSTGETHQLRVHGMDVSECTEAYLVITSQFDLVLAGCSIEEAERKLWGLARCDAGSTTLSPDRVEVGSSTVFTGRYQAGPQGLPAGALVRFSVPNALSEPQTEDAQATGFVSIVAADSPVSIVSMDGSIESHEKTDVICRLESDLAAFQGFTLSYNVEKMYIFATSAFHETDRRYWWSYLPPLAAAVALEEGSQFVSLKEENGHSLEVVPGPCERLHLFLPGRRFASEELSLRGTFTDHYRNVPPSGPIDAQIELWLESGQDRILLGSPAERFVARHRFEIPLPRLTPGIYRAIAYRPGTRDEVARSNPLEIIAQDEGRDRVYWGEIHGHTEMSDGSGDYAGLYRHVREEGYLDFASATDHAECVTDNQWQWMQDVTNGWNQPGRFVTLVGYETEGVDQGDRCVYTSRSRMKMFQGTYAPTGALDVVWGHFHGDEQVVGGPHATMVHETKWEKHDPTVERFAEIYSMWGASDLRDSPFVAPWIEEGRGLTVNDILKMGAKLGFTGGGDCHEGCGGFAAEDPEGQGTTAHTFAAILVYRCGMTAVILPRLDRVSLIQAIRNRQTYATTGARILIDFSVSDMPMGTVGTAEEVVCRATIHAVDPLSLVEIVRDGEVAWSQALDDLDADIEWRDPTPLTGEHYYYLHVVQEDGHASWSSPIWVDVSSPLEEQASGE
jgi:hypothetical protein